VQAAWLHHRFVQIHPFQDGNGRVARAIASLVLIKDGLFLLVVTRDDKWEYIKALKSADGGDLRPLIKLFVKFQRIQFRKASQISEEMLLGEGVQDELQRLDRAAKKIEEKRIASLRKVFELAGTIEEGIKKRLEEIAPNIEESLKRLHDRPKVFVGRSESGTDHYFRPQIIDNANEIDYFANTREYRSWVSLNMYWSRHCKLVFAIHGIGTVFNGSLICAPFLTFKDTNEEGEAHHTMTPIADEGFIFFHTDQEDSLHSRLRPWLERMLRVALRELTQNL